MGAPVGGAARRSIIALAVLAMLASALPAVAATDPLAAEVRFLSLANAERAAVGARSLVLHADLVAAARRQAQAMRDAGRLYHTSDLGSVTTGWTLIGENVGMGPGADAIHDAFMDSPGHRANILNAKYTHGGVGVVVDGSTVWVAEIFMAGSAYTPPFADDDGSPFEPAIVKIFQAGITTGCGPNVFCPTLPVTREQMATFLVRGFRYASTATDYYRDDESSIHEAAINAISAAGITTGCGTGLYCPTSAITRAEMASFLVRALRLPATSTDFFWDDENLAAEDAINRLAAAGLTSGCAAGRYCPLGAVSRGEMAVFLTRALGL